MWTGMGNIQGQAVIQFDWPIEVSDKTQGKMVLSCIVFCAEL